MNQPPLNPDAFDAAWEALYEAFSGRIGDLNGNDCERMAETAIQAYLAAALPEVTSVEELDQLPVGAVVYASNHIGPAERFDVGWMGCGNNAAWSSALLARDGLPARLLYRPGEES